MSQTEESRRVVRRTLAALRRRGFNRSRMAEEPGYVRPGCSQCAVLVINGVACHETGCPNAKK